MTNRIGSIWKAFYELLIISTKVYYLLQTVKKYLRPLSEVFFCMEVKPGPCIQKTCNELKDEIMQWFVGYAMLRWNRSTLLKIQEEGSMFIISRKFSDGIDWGCLVIYIDIIMSFNVDGPTSRGRPNWRWKDVVNPNLRKKHLNISLASDRSKQRNAIRPVKQHIALQPSMSGTRRWNDQ